MFSTTNHPAKVVKVASFKGTKEKAGGLKVRLLFSMPATTLDDFAPGLCASLYRAGDVISAQTTGSALVPKFSALKNLPWSAAIVGADVKMHKTDLFDEADPVWLSDCDIDRFRFGPRDDGMVDIECDVRSRPNEHDAGRLYGWVGSTVITSLTPPAMASYVPSDAHDDDRQGSLDDDGDHADDPDDHDGPTTSDDLSPTAVTADPDASWLRGATWLVLKTDRIKWIRPDGSEFYSSHFLQANGMQCAAAPTLDETIDAAMRAQGESK